MTVIAEKYHLHIRMPDQSVPRPLLWNATWDELARAVTRDLRIPLDRLQRSRFNTDAPAHVTQEGAALFVFSTKYERT